MKKEESLALLITKTVLKTLAVWFMAMVIFALGFYVVNPRASATICGNLGWKKCEISCYELLYARNKDSSDLYNLIVKLGSVQEYEKQNDYIEKLKNLDKYDAFCTSMDNSVIDEYANGNIEKKNLAILYGTNEYMCATEIVNLIKLGEYEKAYEKVVPTKQTDRAFELSVYYYVENLYACSLSDAEKSAYFDKINTEFSEYLAQKAVSLSDGSAAEIILDAYKLLKVRYVQYILALIDGDSQTAYDAWQSSQQTYNNLVEN